MLNRINSRHYSLTKPIKNLASAQPSNPNPSFTLPIAAGNPIPTAHMSTKDQQTIAKIQTEWSKIEVLQEEKVKLAERLERIVNRARERGKYEWKKVGGIDIDELETDVKLGDLGGADLVLPPQGLGSGHDHGRKDKRKGKHSTVPLAIQISSAGSSLGIPSPAGTPSGSRSGSVGRGGSGRRQQQQQQQQEVEIPNTDDMEVEGEVEPDDALYCFCQQKSYGEMIGCDNGKCPYEWFHVKCVNMSGPLPDTWYCPECVTKLGLASSDGKVHKDRKGRKK